MARRLWPDLIAGTLLALLGAACAFLGARQLDPVLLDWDIRDVWFHADLARVFSSMTDRWGPQFRTNVHPLFPLLTAPAVYALRRLTGLDAITAVHAMLASAAALSFAILFATMRLLGCRRLDAIVFSLLAGSSAASVFWFVVPESYAFGAVSIMIPLLVLAVAEYHPLSAWWYTASSALAMTCTVTNWVAGIAATFAAFPWRRAIQITINAFVLVVALWGIQKLLFPSVQFFLEFDAEDTHFMHAQDFGSSLNILRAFVFHSIVMPAIQYIPDRAYPQLQWLMLRVQGSAIGSGTPWGFAAAVAWTILLGLGTWGAMTTRGQRRFRTALAMVLLGQASLHLFYGEETFLYALHYMPLLVLWASFSTLTPARLVALPIAGVVLVAGGINNGIQFREVVQFAQHQGPERHQVQREMRRRPDDPWPRGMGHVVLAWPGSLERDKAYHEPGGSFSPRVGSFGISVWITDQRGSVIHTSDDIPLTDITQDLVESSPSVVPGISTRTPFYEARWTTPTPDRWQLQLRPSMDSAETVQLVIRSVGPAGGPITSLQWKDEGLLVNHRWQLSIRPRPISIELGDERQLEWKTEQPKAGQWADEHGWGYARLLLSSARETSLTVADLQGGVLSLPPALRAVSPPIELDLPDARFASSLRAQLAHILMGVVGKETRPGDPTDFPLPWQRDAAYIVAAVARAGRLSAATELATSLAERDFFGGFGPEADAPGLAIWSLGELAALLSDTAYDRRLWPHIERKADWILKLLATEQPLRVPATGLIWQRLDDNPERTLVAEPARGGLIHGRVDNHWPNLYVNAVSYRGLLEAASWAGRLGYQSKADRWRSAAAALKGVWDKSFRPPDAMNDRLSAAVFWPVRMADTPRQAVRRTLEMRWKGMRDDAGHFRAWPLWPYYDVGEAHQWLALGRPERTWQTLWWFWDHQASPGLYTWGEGLGEAFHEVGDASHRWRFSFHRWREARGWLDPPHVTPQYWAAAQMLLLQLDMLATIDRSADPPKIIVGAGLPASWLTHPLRVRGVPVPGGSLEWSWDGRQVHAVLSSRTANDPTPPLQLQLSPSFPSDTRLQIQKRLSGRLQP